MHSKGSRARGEETASGARAEQTRRSILARAGLAAGGVGLVALQVPDRAAASQLNETFEIVPPAGDAALKLVPSGDVAQSVSVGGAMNLDNTASRGAGVVLYSNHGVDALGRLLVVNQANAANPQHAVRIENAGTAHTVSIFHNPAGGAGDATAEAVDIVSTNPRDTTLGVQGREEGRGTVKITHVKPTGPDAGAAALSIALEGAETACQGIFIGNGTGDVTTGNLLNIRNGGPGTERLVLTAAGRVELAVQGPGGGLVIGGDATLYRPAASVLATDGTLQAAAIQAGSAANGDLTLRSTSDADRGYVRIEDELKLTSVSKSVAGDQHHVAQVPTTTNIGLGAGGGLRGLTVSASISTEGTLASTSLLMFNLNSVVTPSAATDMRAIEIFKSNPYLNGLPGAVNGVTGSIFSSFQHQLRLLPIPNGGTGSFTAVYGFYSPPALNLVGTGWTVSNYSLLRVEAPGGDGPITNLTGLDIRDFNSRGANNYSVRSFGAAMHMRHSGGVNLGSQATPDTLLHLRGNAGFHGSITLDQQATDPAAPIAGGQARLYVKQNKLVVQWNDGSKTLYTTIPLDGAGPYPSTVTVTTDTAAP
jgi:hypothetical protein